VCRSDIADRKRRACAEAHARQIDTARDATEHDLVARLAGVRPPSAKGWPIAASQRRKHLFTLELIMNQCR
jgi:hypothetical protein